MLKTTQNDFLIWWLDLFNAIRCIHAFFNLGNNLIRSSYSKVNELINYKLGKLGKSKLLYIIVYSSVIICWLFVWSLISLCKFSNINEFRVILFILLLINGFVIPFFSILFVKAPKKDG